MSESDDIKARIKLTLTPANVTLGVALLAIGVLHFWHPELVGQAESFALFACAVFGIHVTPWFKRTEEVIDALPQAPAKPKTPPPLPLLMLVGLLSFGTGALVETRVDHAPIVVTDKALVAMHRAAAPITEVEGCHATPEQWALTGDKTLALTNCVLSKVLGGIVDITVLLSCADATEQLIVQIIDDFETKAAAVAVDASDSGASITPADGGGLPIAIKPYYSPSQRMWLALAKQNAIASMALKRASGK